MPPISVDVTKYILGAAEVFYRDPGVLTAWTSVGLTMDEVVARITQTMHNPSDQLNGVDGLLRGLDFKKGGPAEFEFTLPELSTSKLALAIPGVVETAGSQADAGGTPLSTTLAAAAAIGATNIRVVSVTNAEVGDFIRINVAGALAEYRQLTFVGTAGAGGTGLSFRDPLLKAHSNGVAVVESVGDGKNELVASTIRRQPATAYKDWALVSQSPADYYELLINRAIPTTESVEISTSDSLDRPAGVRVTLGARVDETNLASPTWKIRAPSA